LSVVNDWANRDWCCGWNLWNEVIEKYRSSPFPNPNESLRITPVVVGKNPGLSEPASSIEELRKIYHSSSVFLNTSIHSPVPTVLMEAMACGCAIVSTDNCMIPEIIEHGKNGLLANDPKQLQIYIDRLAADPDLAKELGYNAQQTIKEKYSLSRFLDGWNDLFYQTINNYKG
jgi:glycosyltransferase involved in cell wall biosynthesis